MTCSKSAWAKVHIGWFNASVAQSVEQFTRNEQVAGSNPATSFEAQACLCFFLFPRKGALLPLDDFLKIRSFLLTIPFERDIIIMLYVPMAQLDRAFGYGPNGWGFESL